MSDGEAIQLSVRLPQELETGTFSDLAMVWHNEFGFTLDFMVLGMPGQQDGGQQVQPAAVAARVKVPAGVIFQIAKAIADNVQKYENRFGPITPRPSDGSRFPVDHADEEQRDDHSDD